MKEMKYTETISITIEKDIRDILKSLKITDKESYSSVIKRLISNWDKSL